MARETFIDTSGFYSLLVSNDDRHGRAKEWLERAEVASARAVTTDYVLDETATLIKAKGHGHLLKEFFARLEGSGVVRIE